MIYNEENINYNKKYNSFHTVKNFDKNRIIVFTEKTRKCIVSNKEEAKKYKEIVDLIDLANDISGDKNNFLEEAFLHYYKFKPVINFLRTNILYKEGLYEATSSLMEVKDNMYKKHCNEDRFWIDVRDKEAFSRLPHVIGIEIEDKFLVLDGHHRCTLYCIDDNLSLNFDCLLN